jgi:hypothetical protein
MNIIESITNLYENVLPKCTVMLPHDEAIQYFERLMMNGNIITYVKDGELCGFLEYWRCSYEQFGRICANMTLSHEEDLLNGEVALITRMWIIHDLRNGEAFLNMGREFLSKNITATHYAAMQFHKVHKPIQIYSREQILKHYRMEN